MSEPQGPGPGVRTGELPAGALVGDRYEILQPLGEGGFASVYKARDRRTKTEVAVKVLHPHMARARDFARRFEREVEIASRLRHPNTIRVFDTGTTSDGASYLVMEFVKGRPLDEVLAGQGVLPPDRVRHIVTQVLRSLREAHELGVVHRDIKPGNIFLSNVDGDPDFVKVLDFGIAKSLDEGHEQSMTATGAVIGTVSYMAPERLSEFRSAPAADLFSVGIMMIELLEGRVPIAGATAPATMVELLALDRPVPMAESTRHGPLGAVIARAVEKGEANRLATATEMLSAMSGTAPMPAPRHTGGVPTAAPHTPPATETHAPPRPARTPSEETRLALVEAGLDRAPGSGVRAGLVAAGVLAAGFIGWFVTRADAPAPSVVEPAAAPAADFYEVFTQPSGATLRHGNRIVGTTPARIPIADLPPPPVELTARLPGHADATLTLRGTSGVEATALATLEPVAAPSAPAASPAPVAAPVAVPPASAQPEPVAEPVKPRPTPRKPRPPEEPRAAEQPPASPPPTTRQPTPAAPELPTIRLRD
jgi:serine/threonine-protein kinase